MSADLDWNRLETLVSRAAERLRQAAADNQRLRSEVARLEAELENARAAGVENVVPAAPNPSDERSEEVRRRLAQLEGEIESLLGDSAG